MRLRGRALKTGFRPGLPGAGRPGPFATLRIVMLVTLMLIAPALTLAASATPSEAAQQPPTTPSKPGTPAGSGAPSTQPTTRQTVAGQAIPDEYIVVLKPGQIGSAQVASQMAGQRGLTVKHVFQRALNGYVATIPSSQLAAVQSDPRVAYVRPNRIVRARKVSHRKHRDAVPPATPMTISKLKSRNADKHGKEQIES